VVYYVTVTRELTSARTGDGSSGGRKKGVV
jgi:hypothetical protein